jgi:hypothetical protein
MNFPLTSPSCLPLTIWCIMFQAFKGKDVNIHAHVCIHTAAHTVTALSYAAFHGHLVLIPPVLLTHFISYRVLHLAIHLLQTY